MYELKWTDIRLAIEKRLSSPIFIHHKLEDFKLRE